MDRPLSTYHWRNILPLILFLVIINLIGLTINTPVITIVISILIMITWFKRLYLAKFIMRRFLLFIPTFFIVSILAFSIVKQSPYDPVDTIMASMSSSGSIEQTNATQRDRIKLRSELGLSQPTFYFQINSLADCDTLYKIPYQTHKENLDHLTSLYGNWEHISTYYKGLLNGKKIVEKMNPDSLHASFSSFNSPEKQVDTTLLILLHAHTERVIDSIELSNYRKTGPDRYVHVLDSTKYLKNDGNIEGDTIFDESGMAIALLYATKTQNKIGFKYRADSSKTYLYSKETILNDKNHILNSYNRLLSQCDPLMVRMSFDSLNFKIDSLDYLEQLKSNFKENLQAYKTMSTATSIWKTYIPNINWHGLSNQYHAWFFGSNSDRHTAKSKGLIHGDFGMSYQSGKPVKTDLIRKFRLSLELVLIAVFLAYLISIPIGVISARKRNSWFDKGSGLLLFIMYAMPNFFVGLLLINYFANPDHLEWFHATGFKPDDITDITYYNTMNYWERLQMSWPYMVLPLITYCYAMFAFISKIMRVSLIDTLEQDYIRTARAKGLSEHKVIWKHALRNSLLPIITMFANIFPLAVGGSVIVEMIFNYQGMGQWSLNAIYGGDFPIIIAIFCIAGILTMFGYLLSDILYAIIDPRISIGKKI